MKPIVDGGRIFTAWSDEDWTLDGAAVRVSMVCFDRAAGTEARLDNKKAKTVFGGKVSMLGAEVVLEITSHPVGGVCPFGLPRDLPVYCDISLKTFDEVVPAAGSTHSAVRIAPLRMAELVGAQWVDVCQTPEAV